MATEKRAEIRRLYLEPQHSAIGRFLESLSLSTQQFLEIEKHTISLVEAVRSRDEPGVMQSFLGEYGLSTDEGVALMCLAEALLRVPDDETIDQLIQDKIVPHDWASHIGDSGSILVNASTWALMLTGHVLEDESDGVVGALRAVVKRMGEPVIRLAVEHAMREMGEQFVLGQDIAEATTNGNTSVLRGYTYSYDMLGEAAVTDADAIKYLDAYGEAIDALAARAHSKDLRENPGISVKLSALHPRYISTHQERMLPVMQQRLLLLAQKAKEACIGLNIDAEEADRLDISLDIIEAVAADSSLTGWDGFGVVVQAYGPRALSVIDWLYETAVRLDRKIMVRLVKGAYWDSEIKHAQVEGIAGYPVFTAKCVTDLSYITCAQHLLKLTDRIYPQFATHNAHTIASVLSMAGENKMDFEFQRLHGMGDVLHDIVKSQNETRCRIYAPVGTHEDLLAYLVRRLLENGANSSFVNQIVDERITPIEIAKNPVTASKALLVDGVSPLPMPQEIFAPERINSKGWELTDPVSLEALEQTMAKFLMPKQWHWDEAENSKLLGKKLTITNPANSNDIVGSIKQASTGDAEVALKTSNAALPGWSSRPVTARSEILLRIATLYEENKEELFALLIREAGKTRADAISELREAVDFLRYYASRAGDVEHNTRPRGCIVCISPWNFPLAIFTGQIAGALVTGNTVVAKPAEQTPIVALRAVQLMHQAGVDPEVLQLLPGLGETIGAALVASSNIAGVCFTGSTQVAKVINRQLAISAPVEAMLLAETGGLNAMIVDSTALLEQAVLDIVQGAFQSAGQRCSALRIAYVQEDVRDKLLTMLSGAMDELVVDDPIRISTDVGPIIDREACEKIQDYCDQMAEQGRVLHQADVETKPGFIAPTVIEVEGIERMNEEIFGPVLHLATFTSSEIDAVVEAVNQSGYGLTFGLHTRIDIRVQRLVERINAGNLYVNRNQIGAVVGSQPFGGEGLSGTGPKAGGPHYLRRFRQLVNTEGTSDRPRIDVRNASVDLRAFHKCLEKANQADYAKPEEQLLWLRKVLRGRAAEAVAACAALDSGPIDLPGPTGESNQISIYPAGTVICISHSADSLLSMCVQALRLGNHVIAIGNGASKALSALSTNGSLQILEGDIPVEWLKDGEFDAVAIDESVDRRAIRQLLSEKEGPLIRLITETIYPYAYGTERAICIDTTAAGGNAALLAEMT